MKNIGHHARLKVNENLFRYRAYLEGNFFCCARARANLRAVMTQKSCAVGMRNAILRNHLNYKNSNKTVYSGAPAAQRTVKRSTIIIKTAQHVCIERGTHATPFF